MNSGKTIFAQLMDFVPAYEFRCCVERYQGNYKIKSFSCWDQFVTLAFAQLTYRESLREISKRVCEQPRPSFITWAFAATFLATLWPMPIKFATGESMPISLMC